MSATTETKETLEPTVLLRLYETVARIRAFDDKAKALITNAQAFFVHYPVRGHEIISAAVAAAIEPDDYMTATYRGVADEIAKGVPLHEMWAEMLGPQADWARVEFGTAMDPASRLSPSSSAASVRPAAGNISGGDNASRERSRLK